MNEMEQETVQNHARDNIDMVIINFIQFNKNHSILTTNLEMSAGQSNIMVPYIIDTGSDGNIMPLHMYKKLFPNITDEQLAAAKNKNDLLKTYIKTTITQLGTCTIIVEHKNNKKKCRFFVVPRNRQALLGMPDTDVLNIIEIDIDSIGTEDARDSKWCASMHTVWEPEPKQETERAEKCYTNMDSILKLRGNNTKPMVKTKSNKTTEYFLSGLTYESNKKKSAESTQQIYKDFDDMFNGTGCFEGTISLQLKPDRKPYQALLGCVAYALPKLFQEELEKLQKLHIIAPLGVKETSEWCNSFVLVPKANGKVRLCLDQACLNQALIRPIHGGPTLNDILPKLNNAKYLSLIDASAGYHNLKLDENSSYLTTCTCQFGQYRYK